MRIEFRNSKTHRSGFFLAILLLAAWVPLTQADDSPKMNVLFLAIDDLRPELGAYGADYMQTPSIDRLAGEQVAELAIEVGGSRLRSLQHADHYITHCREPFGNDPQRHRLAGSRLTADQGKAAFLNKLFHLCLPNFGKISRKTHFSTALDFFVEFC